MTGSIRLAIQLAGARSGQVGALQQFTLSLSKSLGECVALGQPERLAVVQRQRQRVTVRVGEPFGVCFAFCLPERVRVAIEQREPVGESIGLSESEQFGLAKRESFGVRVAE